VDAEALLDAQR